MRLVERLMIFGNHQFYPEIYLLCFLFKNFYNYANYLVSQSLIFENLYHSASSASRKILSFQRDYQAIPTKVSQKILTTL